MSVVNHQCFALSEKDAEWLWHMRFGHLNFKDLSRLSKDSMVIGLPLVKVPENVCRECVQCKQTRESFRNICHKRQQANLK